MGRRLDVLVLLALASCGPAAPAAPAPRDAGFKPFAFAILGDQDKGDDLCEIAPDFARFHELGISTWRGSLGWNDSRPGTAVIGDAPNYYLGLTRVDRSPKPALASSPGDPDSSLPGRDRAFPRRGGRATIPPPTYGT